VDEGVAVGLACGDLAAQGVAGAKAHGAQLVFWLLALGGVGCELDVLVLYH
jgi:hypothetical protein